MRHDAVVAKQSGSSRTPATVALTKARIAFTTHSYEHDPSAASFGLEAANALGLAVEHVFKTLLADIDGNLVVGIVPVHRKLDLKALAASVGGKRASMADPAIAERSTGYVVGGISPIGQRRALKTVIDDSAQTIETVYVSGGRRGFDLGLSPLDLQSITSAMFAPIARD